MVDARLADLTNRAHAMHMPTMSGVRAAFARAMFIVTLLLVSVGTVQARLEKRAWFQKFNL